MMNSFSYNDALKLIPKARPRKFLEPRCDPVLDHCIKLWKFHDEIEHLIPLTANLKEMHGDSEREPILRYLPPISEIPELILKIPDEKLNSPFEEVELSDESIMKLISKSIARVLFILGYTDVSSHLLQMLSKIIIDYVKSLIEKMVQLLPENGSISLDLLEAALQSKGINGIGELHSFYAQRIVNFHDKFYLKCRQLCDDLRNNLKKPDVLPVKIITKSSVEDSTKYSLDSGMLAEDIFLRKKVSRKSVHFSPQTAICDKSNDKKLLMTNIAADLENSPAEKSVYSESCKNLPSMLANSTVSLKSKHFDSHIPDKLTSSSFKNSSQITGLFNNSLYNCDKILSDNSSIINDVNEVPDKSAASYSDYESSDQSSVFVDLVKQNTHGSKLVDESWDQDAKIVCNKDVVMNNNAFDSELVEKSFEQDASVPAVSKKRAMSTESIDNSSDQGINIDSIEEKGFDKTAMNSELEQYANIIPNKKKACSTNAVALKLTDKILNQDFNMVNEEENYIYKNAFDFESIKVSAIQDTSGVPNENKVFNKNAFDSEPWNQDANIARVKKKSFDKKVLGLKSIEDSLKSDNNITFCEEKNSVNNEIDHESLTNLEYVLPDNTDSSECTEHDSELSCELNNMAHKHLTKKSKILVCNSTDKSLHNGNAKRKLADLKNFGALSNNTGSKKKKLQLLKRKKVFRNDTNKEMPSEIKDDIENFEHSNSNLHYNINSTKNFGEKSLDNGFHNHHNPDVSLVFEDCSVTISGSETNIDCMQEGSSSSENETEQIWVSL